MDNITSIKKQWLGLTLFLLFMGGFIFFNIFSMSHLDTAEIELHSNVDPIAQLTIQGAFSILVFGGLSIFLLSLVVHIDVKSLVRPFQSREVIFILAITLLAMIVNSAIGVWNIGLDIPDSGFEELVKKMESSLKIMTKQLIDFQSLGHFMVAFLVIAIIPAIVEELLFRGFLQNVLYKISNNSHFAIWVSAILFSAIHLQFYGFFPRLFLGLLLGYIFYWTKNLYASILVHFLNNGISIISIYIFILFNEKTLAQEALETAAPLGVVLVALIIFCLAIFTFKRRFQLTPQDE